MSAYSEVDALKDIDGALSKIDDAAARDRVLKWAWEKYSDQPAPSSPEEKPSLSKKTRKQSSGKKNKKSSTSSRPSIDKSLNLRPKGTQSFADFVSEKKPSSNYDKCAVAVYYLRRTLEVKGTIDAVFTCFKDAGWRVPADLRNALQSTASKKGWLDTKDTDDIKMTPIGENHVEHDLPPKSTD